MLPPFPAAALEPAFVPASHLADADAALAVRDDAIAVEQAASDPSDGLVRLVRLLGERGLLELVTDARFGGRRERVSVTSLCLVRERLGHASPLVELAFAMQGLGSYPMTLAAEQGSATAAERWLPPVVRGEAVAAFALTEPEAGTDLGGIRAQATREGHDYVIDGQKCFISNAGIADVYVVFARARDRLSAFAVPGDAPGLHVKPQRVLGGHPIGEVHFEGVRVHESMRVGEEGRGMSLALGTLHRFRTTVGAAALGFAQRALDEAVAHVRARRQFGAPLAELAIVQAKIGDMACALEGARLLVYRAAAALDAGGDRDELARKGSMAKLVATEAAQRVIDDAVQLHGGRGVCTDGVVARLYEEIRALRIYEGTSDVQRLLVARALLR